jgi:hypothetical protein
MNPSFSISAGDSPSCKIDKRVSKKYQKKGAFGNTPVPLNTGFSLNHVRRFV